MGIWDSLGVWGVWEGLVRVYRDLGLYGAYKALVI